MGKVAKSGQNDIFDEFRRIFMARDIYDDIFDDFMRMCPWLDRKVVKWYRIGDLEIRVELDDGRAAEYDSLERCFIIRDSVKELEDRRRGDTEEKWKVEFAVRLHKRMHMVGVSQETLSYLTGVSQGAIAKYVNGLQIPNCYNLKKIANALGCSTDNLINF